MKNLDISILGAGWLGAPLAEALALQGWRVWANAQWDFQHPKLFQEPWRALANADAAHWAKALGANQSVWAIPPRRAQQSEQQYLGLIQDWISFQPSPTQALIFCSSTSVYQDTNDWVQEDSALDPQALISQAEALLRQSGLPHLILRFGGLMGGERYLGKYVQARPLPASDAPVNYIHQSDAVAMTALAILQGLRGTYNVVAPEHPIKSEVAMMDCTARGLALPSDFLPSVSWKKVDGSRLAQALNYTFQFPDPRHFPRP